MNKLTEVQTATALLINEHGATFKPVGYHRLRVTIADTHVTVSLLEFRLITAYIQTLRVQKEVPHE